MKNGFVLAILLFGLNGIGFGQGQASIDQKKAEMKKVAKLVGQWKGSGWIQQGQTRETFTGTETVQKKLDGLALLVEGSFMNPSGKAIHQTMAVLSCNDNLSGYKFATYLANGISGVQDFGVVGDHFEWGFQIPNVGIVRYAIRTNNGVWSEIGEFSRDQGKTWFKNFEMKLDLVK